MTYREAIRRYEELSEIFSEKDNYSQSRELLKEVSYCRDKEEKQLVLLLLVVFFYAFFYFQHLFIRFFSCLTFFFSRTENFLKTIGKLANFSAMFGCSEDILCTFSLIILLSKFFRVGWKSRTFLNHHFFNYSLFLWLNIKESVISRISSLPDIFPLENYN